MHKLMNYVCDELEDIEKKADKGKLSMSEIEYADKLASLKQNILKSDKLMDEGYSGDSHMDGYSNRMYPYSMNEGMSYARGRGSNARRDSMGRYSSDDGRYSDYSRDDYSERRR